MAVLKVVHYGDPILRKECKQVTDYKVLPEIIENMFDTMSGRGHRSCSKSSWN